MYTLDYTLDQLERCHDLIARGMPIRIIHVLCEDSKGFSSHWEDHYIVLVDCDDATYLMLCLI